MKAIKTIITLTSCLALSWGAAACGDSDDSNGDGDGDTSGDGDGDTGDGDGDTGDGDGDTGDGDTGDGDGDGDTGDGDMGGNNTCMTILETAAATDDLSSLVAAVEAAGIEEALMADGLTVFAPTNEAFDDLLDDLGLEFGDLTADNLIPILTYHVADSEVDSEAAIAVAGMDDNTFTTLGGTITLDVEGEDLVIDTAEASATVVMPNIEACNGIVHVVDAVMLPSITDIVVSQDRFSGLETLIGASETDPTNVAEVLDAESGDGAFTLFAPNNDAVDDLLDPDPGLSGAQVTDALLYHAYSAADPVDAATAVGLDATISMANGDDLDVLGDDQALTVTLTDAANNDVSVVVTDIYASNGIIHVIDAVLIPADLAE